MPQICTKCKGQKVIPGSSHSCWMCQGTGQTECCTFCGSERSVVLMQDHRCMASIAAKTDNPLARFRVLCEMHDTSYDYTDDGSVWRRGHAEHDIIKRYAADHLQKDQALAIWNEVVREKFPTYEGHYPFIKTEWK